MYQLTSLIITLFANVLFLTTNCAHEEELYTDAPEQMLLLLRNVYTALYDHATWSIEEKCVNNIS